MQTRNEEPKRKRFRIVKLEDRIVPSHLPAVAEVVVAGPAADIAPTHAHKVAFVHPIACASHPKTEISQFCP